MYRKQADRLIVRDIARRVAEMQKTGKANWKWALIHSARDNPGWFRHRMDDLIEGVGRLLEEEGLDLPEDASGLRFVTSVKADDA